MGSPSQEDWLAVSGLITTTQISVRCCASQTHSGICSKWQNTSNRNWNSPWVGCFTTSYKFCGSPSVKISLCCYSWLKSFLFRCRNKKFCKPKRSLHHALLFGGADKAPFYDDTDVSSLSYSYRFDALSHSFEALASFNYSRYKVSIGLGLQDVIIINQCRLMQIAIPALIIAVSHSISLTISW